MVEQYPTNNSQDKDQIDPIIIRESTNGSGVVVPELLAALLDREKIIDNAISGKSPLDRQEAIRGAGFFEKAEEIRNLKAQNGIESWRLPDLPGLDNY